MGVRAVDFSTIGIDKGSGTPIAAQIAQAVLRAIEENQLPPGSRLPTERSLAGALGIARGTVKSAYRSLEVMGVIDSRQGSGSFVRRDEGLSRKVKRKKAVDLIDTAIAALTRMGFATGEIHQLVEISLARGSKDNRALNIALIYDNPEMLLDFKRQLSYLPGVCLSIFLLESITEDRSPETLLRSFALIITPTALYQRILLLVPGLAGRVMQAAVCPTGETLVELTALPRSARVGIISRTSTFLGVVRESLLRFGFLEGHISSYFEMDYTIGTYFPGGIDALVSFADAHIFTNADFEFRNNEFLGRGGRLIVFRHEIERGTVLYIEDRVRQLLSQ